MTRLTRMERLSLAVAEAIVIKHLGCHAYFQVTKEVDLRHSILKQDGKQVILKTVESLEFSGQPSQVFVVEVGFTADTDYEYEADLHNQDGLQIKRFWWDICGPRLNVTENPAR